MFPFFVIFTVDCFLFLFHICTCTVLCTFLILIFFILVLYSFAVLTCFFLHSYFLYIIFRVFSSLGSIKYIYLYTITFSSCATVSNLYFLEGSITILLVKTQSQNTALDVNWLVISVFINLTKKNPTENEYWPECARLSVCICSRVARVCVRTITRVRGEIYISQVLLITSSSSSKLIRTEIIKQYLHNLFLCCFPKVKACQSEWRTIS